MTMGWLLRTSVSMELSLSDSLRQSQCATYGKAREMGPIRTHKIVSRSHRSMAELFTLLNFDLIFDCDYTFIPPHCNKTTFFFNL